MNLNKIFHFFLITSVAILWLPIKLLAGVYSLTILGWLWFLFFLPVTIIILIVLTVKDIKAHAYKSFLIRLLYFAVSILVVATLIYLRNHNMY